MYSLKATIMKKLTLLSASLIASSTIVHSVHAQDFIYIMPSKEIAETGEDFFFKAYQMDKQTFALSDLSRTLYLQVCTASDSVVWSEKYPLVSGRGNGHIYIGADWPQGEYFIEGYTQSSFTDDSTQAIRPRRIRVVDRVAQMDSISNQAIKNDSDQKIKSKHRFDLFPEGGHLVNEIYSVVAFKATYGNGIPEEVSGKVFEDGKEIASIQTLHDGMGRFSINPTLGKEYKVILDDGRTIPFPAIEPEGLSLRVSNNNAKGLTLLVSSSNNTPQNFTIIAKQNGIECSTAKGIVNGQQIVKLPAEYFTLQGIVEITLYDGNERPVAERLVFVNPHKRLNISAITDKLQYYRRDTGKVSLKVTDTIGNPTKAELAVTIFDKAYLYQPGHENILTHCFLSEQIRGNIFNPTYYFDTQNEDRLQALDLLMRTQGWRNYVWDKEPTTSQPLLTDGVCGMQTTRRDIDGKIQVLKAFSSKGDTCFIFTDSLGKFELVAQLMDKIPGNIYIKPLLLDKYKAEISIVNPFDTINEYRRNLLQYIVDNHLISTTDTKQMVTNDDKTVLLNEVVINGKRRPQYRDKVTGFLDSLANADCVGPEYVCVHEWFNGEKHAFLNDYREGYTSHPWGDICNRKHTKPIPGEKYLMVKFKGDGVRGSWVLIEQMEIIYPKQKFTDKQLLEMYGLTRVKGYYPKREFYQPDSFDLASPIADPRNLLQWQPQVITDENGNAEIPFAASDVNSEFIGIVEAIDGNGLMGYQTFNFQVFKHSF